MDIYTLMTNIVFGATAGYVTNNFAIKMLFKEYGPLGGVILKTKDEFIKNTSQLIEREIINHHTLEDELESKEVETVINEIINEIFTQNLPKNLKKQDLKDIPELDQSLNNILESILQNRDFSKIDEDYGITENIFKKEQLYSIVTNIYTELLKKVKNKEDNLVKKFLNSVYENISQKKIKNIINDEFREKFKKNINREIDDINLYLKNNYDQKLDDLLKNIYDNLGLDKVLENSINEYLEEKNNHIINKEVLDLLSDILLENLILTLDSEEGRESYNRLKKDLLKRLNNDDIKFEELIGIENKSKSREFIEKEVDLSFELLKKWLDYNENDIEKLLDETLKEVLEEGSGFKNSLQKFLYNFIGEEGVGKYEPVAKLKKYLDTKNENSDNFKKFQGVLEEYGPGDLLQLLDEREVLTADNLLSLVKNNKNQLEELLTENISKKDLNDYIKKMSESITLDFKKPLISNLKNNYLYTQNLTNDLQNLIDNNFYKITEQKVNDLINIEDYNTYMNKVEKYIIKKLEKNEDKNKEFIVEFLRKKINDNNFELNNLVKNKEVFNSLVDFIEDTEENLFKNLIESIENNEKFSKKTTDIIIDLIENNLSNILDGKIEEAVAGSLYKLEDKDLKQAVEDFVGKELKPITIFGGGLGALGGTLLYFLQNLSTIDVSMLSGPILSVLIYAFIGYLTNVIALWMIFHPYNEQKFLSYSLPLTPGVVAQNKDRFANSMGEFVDSELLNASSVTKILEGKKNEIIETLHKNISANNYSKIEKLLVKNSEEITDKLSENLFVLFENNEKEIRNFISNKILSLDFSVISGLLTKIDNKYLFEILSNNLGSLVNIEAKQIIKKEKNLSYFFDDSKKKLMDDKIDSLNKELWDYLSKNLNPNSLDFLLDKFSSDLEIIELKMLISKSNKRLFKTKIAEKIENYNFGKTVDYINNINYRRILQSKKDKNIIGKFLANIIFFYISENRENIKETLLKIANENIKKENNSFLANLMFNLSGIDELTNEVIDHFIDEKLEVFLAEKEESLEKIGKRFLNQLVEKEIEESGLYFKEDGLSNLFKSFEDINVNKDLVELNDIFIEEIFNKDLSYFKEKYNLKDNKNIKPEYKKILKVLINNLEKKLNDNQTLVEDISSKFLKNFANEKIDDIKIADLLKSIGDENLANIFENIIKELDDDKIISTFFYDLNLIFADDKLEDYLDKNYLEESLRKILKNNKKDLKEDFHKITPFYLENSIDLIEKETLDYFSLLFLDTSFDSLQSNFIDLINAFKLKNITKKEVEQMSSEEIEELFYSFAGKYMKRLKIYGLSGGGFGFISEILLKYLLS